MNFRKAAPLAAGVLIAALAACSSAEPTATIPAGSPTPVTGVGLFIPHVIETGATDTNGVGSSWGRMRRWDARLGWSIELPDRGEWQFVRNEDADGLEVIEARRLDGDEMPFVVVRYEIGHRSEELLPEGYDCGSALRTVLNPGGVARSDALPVADLAGTPARMSRIRVIEPAGVTGSTIAVCAAVDGYLYMASGHAPESGDEEDVTEMMTSMRVQG